MTLAAPPDGFRANMLAVFPDLQEIYCQLCAVSFTCPLKIQTVLKIATGIPNVTGTPQNRPTRLRFRSVGVRPR